MSSEMGNREAAVRGGLREGSKRKASKIGHFIRPIGIISV